jgi:general secretion pathway protein D
VRTLTQNSRIACIVILSAVIGSITLTGAASQAPPPTGRPGQSQDQTAEERRKALEKLLQDMQKTAPPTQTANPAPPAQNPAATPIPSIVQRAPLLPDQINLSYDGGSLVDFINQIADTLNITPILIDPDVKGTVYIHSAVGTSISRQDLFPIFTMVLKNNNAALVKAGNIYKIVPISQGLREGLEIIQTLPPAKPDEEKAPAKKAPTAAGPTGQATPPGGTPPPAQAALAPGQVPPQPQAAPAAPAKPPTPEPSRLATHVIRVEFVPVTTLIEPLKLFMTEGGVIMPYDRQNMLIITDYTDNVQKLMEVVHLLDNSYLDADLLELIEIKFNVAADVLDDLKKVFSAGKDGSTGVSLVALDRLNAILVMANSKRALEEVKRWITRLDTTTGRSVQTFIYTVENGTASNIAMVLSMLFGGGEGGAPANTQQTGTGGATQGGTGAGGRSSSGAVTPFQSSTSGASRSTTGMSGNTGYGGAQQGMTQQGFGNNAANPYGFGAGVFGGQNSVSGPRLSQGVGMSAMVLNAGQFSGLQGTVRLVSDDLNNSLIIQGSAADYAFLLETIKRMDVLPRQVIIDARIFEIDLTDDLSFGVSATLQARPADQQLTTGSMDGTTGALSAASFAFVGASREILMNLSALRQKTKVRILEAPSILALDGTPARIQVGGSVPVPAMSYVSAAGGATTGVNYTDTGTSLQITPRISASGTVTLQIYHDLRSPGANTALGPTFTTTNVETTLAVKDGESVAIAGLIRESDSNARNGVPLLSDIPILGALFGRTSHSGQRTELLIMITPHVIRTPERFREMTDDLKNSLRNVGKYADEKQQQMREDLEQGRKNSEDKLKKSIPPAAKKEEKAAAPPKVIKKEEKPATPPNVIKKSDK